MSPWPWRMGAAALRPLSSCSRGIRRRLWQMRCGTAERYKETLWYSALSTRPYRPDDCGIQGAWNRNHPKVFRPDYPLQHGAESGLSDCQQRASALLLSHRLRAQRLCFSAGYARVSKLIGGATNSPLASLISSHHIPCVICGRCSHCPHPSRMSPWRAAM